MYLLDQSLKFSKSIGDVLRDVPPADDLMLDEAPAVRTPSRRARAAPPRRMPLAAFGRHIRLARARACAAPPRPLRQPRASHPHYHSLTKQAVGPLETTVLRPRRSG